MSLDSFWRLAQPRSRAQKAAGIRPHGPVQTVPAGSALSSISACFLAVPQGIQLTPTLHAEDIPLEGCCAALTLSQMFWFEKFTSHIWLVCLAQCFEVTR